MNTEIVYCLKFVLLAISLTVLSWVVGTYAANAKTIKIAVIDSGFDFNSNWINAEKHSLTKPILCKEGHMDLTGEGLGDAIGHGTHVAGLIAKYAKGSDYCLVIIKVFGKAGNSVFSSIQGIKYAIELKVDIINYSGGGLQEYSREKEYVLTALNNNIMFVAAAGNEKSDLNENKFYPALYDNRIVVVGALNNKGKRLDESNYGPQVDIMDNGEKVLSLLPNDTYGELTGTSQATAIVTGKLISSINKTLTNQRISK